jgi:hypothetical protein
MAGQQLQQFRCAVSEIRREAADQFLAFQQDFQAYSTQLTQAITPTATHLSPERIQKIAKIEAFELWVQKTPDAENQISAQTLLHRVTTKISHTLKTLKAELQQTTNERDELQAKEEEHQENTSDLLQWEHLLGYNKIEDPINTIAATMKNLAPPISIVQYYLAYKPMILNWSSLPDVRTKSHLSQEQFQGLWKKANPAARDLLVFMWAMKDLLIPKGIVEVTTANPPFYLTRFCVSALTHINRHHKEFYTNLANRNCLPQIEPYDPELIKEIQQMANEQFPDFLSALDTLAGEDTELLREAIQQHQNLVRKFPESFPPAFYRIQLHGYIARALEDRKHTLEQRQISTPHARTLLYLPQYDPASMKITKRS